MKENIVHMGKIGNNQKIVAGKFRGDDRETSTHEDS
jgi:hypothetical protein